MIRHLYSVAFVSMPGSGEWIIILVIGLLIFGRRLPEVARSLGKSVNEFKRGLREFQDSADEVTRDVKTITNDVAYDVSRAVDDAASGPQEAVYPNDDAVEASSPEEEVKETASADSDDPPVEPMH